MEASYLLSCSATLIHVANSLRMPPLQLRALLRSHALTCGPGGDRTLVSTSTAFHGRCIGLEDAAHHDAIGKHVELSSLHSPEGRETAATGGMKLDYRVTAGWTGCDI
jgi:hypothetical protein